MERIPRWYSILKYMPDAYKGELLNIGVITHTPTTGEILIFILKHTNPKLKSILPNDHMKNSYKILRKHIIDISLEDSPSYQDDSFDYYNKHGYLNLLAENLPKNFILSQPGCAVSKDSSKTQNQLLETYIGKEFIKVKEEKPRHYKNKTILRNDFKQLDLLDTKIAVDQKIKHPILEDYYEIDFTFKNGKINFIQTLPEKINELHDWYYKIDSYIHSFSEDKELILCNNDHNQFISDEIKRTTHNMVDSLDTLKKGSKIQLVSMNTPEYNSLCDKILNEGKLIEEFQDELLRLA